MEKFAKVFESHDRQFLVKKGGNDDGNPKLSVITVVEDAEIDLGFTFPEDEWDALDKAFDTIGQEQIDVYGKQLDGCTTALDCMKRLQG